MIKYCPSTLSKGFKSYSPSALKLLFNGKKVDHVLGFLPPQQDEEVAAAFRKNRTHLSISGVQLKQSLLLDNKTLRLTKKNEQGEFILKPIPHREVFSNVDQLPANENLCMQLAKQVYQINTAENGLVFFKNAEPAYLTKRFDRLPNGDKVHQEDFAVLMGRSPEINGAVYKNEGSYEQLAECIRANIPAYAIELERFYRIVLFNYLFCNGDAHLKNFSIQMTSSGDYRLAPAYDLINTKIHLKEDSAMALSDGLFKNGFETESFKANGFYAYDDFFEFGNRIGLLPKRIQRILNFFRQEHSKTKELIQQSFLDHSIKNKFNQFHNERLKALNYSFTNKI